MADFVIVAEAKADAVIARGLADRVFYEEGPDWMREYEPEEWHKTILPGLRNWEGLEPGSEFSQWRKIKQLSRKFPKLQFLIKNKARRNEYDYSIARKAIQLAVLLRLERVPDAIVLIRDLDSQLERRQSLLNARADEPETMVVIVATPHQK